MRNARDTFLRFLADNSGLPVHNLRRDPEDPELSLLQTNAINVQFLSDAPKVDVSEVLATVDVVYEKELDAVDAMKKVWDILGAAAQTPLLDYTNPASPVPLGSRLLFWNPEAVRFRPVYSDVTCRYSCLLTLFYQL